MTGTTFAHSRVVRRLNGGGMNILYEAEDLPIRPLLRIEFNPKHFRGERESRFLDSAGHPHSRMIRLRSK